MKQIVSRPSQWADNWDNFYLKSYLDSLVEHYLWCWCRTHSFVTIWKCRRYQQNHNKIFHNNGCPNAALKIILILPIICIHSLYNFIHKHLCVSDHDAADGEHGEVPGHLTDQCQQWGGQWPTATTQPRCPPETNDGITHRHNNILWTILMSLLWLFNKYSLRHRNYKHQARSLQLFVSPYHRLWLFISLQGSQGVSWLFKTK